jgi:opacity protein-like surface antigen
VLHRLRGRLTLVGASSLLLAAVAAISLSSSAFAADRGAGEGRYDVPAASEAYGVPTAGGSPPPAKPGPGLPFSEIDIALLLGGGLLLLGGTAVSVGVASRVAAHRGSGGDYRRRRLPARIASGAVRR